MPVEALVYGWEAPRVLPLLDWLHSWLIFNVVAVYCMVLLISAGTPITPLDMTPSPSGKGIGSGVLSNLVHFLKVVSNLFANLSPGVVHPLARLGN